MLPCDRNPEKEMRQRFIQREADMRDGSRQDSPIVTLLGEAKVMSPFPFPVWLVDIRFDKKDFENEFTPPTLSDSLVDSFMREVGRQRLEVEERLRERLVTVKVPARSGKEAMKEVNEVLARAIKAQRDSRLQSRGRR